MIIKFIAILFLFLSIVSCSSDIKTSSYETTIFVTDMDNNPLVGQKIGFIKTRGNMPFFTTNSPLPSPDVTAITDNTGRVLFKYNLTTADTHEDVAHFFVTEETKWKQVTLVSNIPSRVKRINKKAELTMQMDTLRPFKIRLAKKSTALYEIHVSPFSSEKMNGKYFSFNNFVRSNVGEFDSIITVNVFSKAPIILIANVMKISPQVSYAIDGVYLDPVFPKDHQNKLLEIIFWKQ